MCIIIRIYIRLQLFVVRNRTLSDNRGMLCHTTMGIYSSGFGCTGNFLVNNRILYHTCVLFFFHTTKVVFYFLSAKSAEGKFTLNL